MSACTRYLLAVILSIGLSACATQYPFPNRKAESAAQSISENNPDVSVIRYGDNIIVSLPTDSFFAINSTRLRTRRFSTLNDLVRLVQAYGDTPVIIAGHTDNVGSVPFNEEISRKQAHRIMAYLWAHGVDFNRIQVLGLGEARAIASNQRVTGSAMNRRIEIRLRRA